MGLLKVFDRIATDMAEDFGSVIDAARDVAIDSGVLPEGRRKAKRRGRRQEDAQPTSERRQD